LKTSNPTEIVFENKKLLKRIFKSNGDEAVGRKGEYYITKNFQMCTLWTLTVAVIKTGTVIWAGHVAFME
jgi:hypothetical protein